MTDTDAVTVSGTVYSALPSGSGVLVVANGTSTIIGPVSTTHGNLGQADATARVEFSGKGTSESAALYTTQAMHHHYSYTWHGSQCMRSLTLV